MSAKIETKIWLALKSRIDTLLPSYPKAWPSQKFEVPHSSSQPSPYLSIGRVTAAPVRRVIAHGKPHDRAGFLMVTLVHPLGKNVAVYDQLAAEIAEHFKDGTQMRYDGLCVTVTSYPYAQDGYEDNGYWFVPVRIAWRCFA